MLYFMLSLLLSGAAQAEDKFNFAELSPANIVLRVIVADQKFIDDTKKQGVIVPPGVTATEGDSYDADKKLFFKVDPPFPSWVRNQTTLEWEPPVPRPSRDVVKDVVWNEEGGAWVTKAQLDTAEATRKAACKDALSKVLAETATAAESRRFLRCLAKGLPELIKKMGL